MRHKILALISSSLFIAPLHADIPTWNAIGHRVGVGGSGMFLNYSGASDYTKKLHTSTKITTYAKNSSTSRTIDEGDKNVALGTNAYASGFVGDWTPYFSYELTHNIGIMFTGSISYAHGFSISNDLGSPHSLNFSACGGLFYHTESYRIFALGGAGFALGGPLGYPKALEEFKATGKIEGVDGFINGGSDTFGKVNVGFDYRLSTKLSWGFSYTFERSIRTTQLANDANINGSTHNVMVHLSLDTHSF